jgi:hypothetical protein
MNEVVININPQKSSVIEFNLEIVGDLEADVIVPSVRFCIKLGSHRVLLDCVRKVANTGLWTCDLDPIVKNLSKNTYTFKVEVIVDDMFFTPIEGVMNIRVPYSISTATSEFEKRHHVEPARPAQMESKKAITVDETLPEKDQKAQRILKESGHAVKGKVKLSDMLRLMK